MYLKLLATESDIHVGSAGLIAAAEPYEKNGDEAFTIAEFIDNPVQTAVFAYAEYQ